MKITAKSSQESNATVCVRRSLQFDKARRFCVLLDKTSEVSYDQTEPFWTLENAIFASSLFSLLH